MGNLNHPGWMLQYCSNDVDFVAIDVPFGWPKPFVEALIGYEISMAFVDPGQRYQLRETDLWVRDALPRHLSRSGGPNPLSVSTDRIGATAMVGTVLLHALADRGFSLLPSTGNRSRAAVEVYPAASLWVWHLPHKGYKKKEGEHKRREILCGLKRLFDLRIRRCHERRLVAHDHCLDALIAALTAQQYANCNTFDPEGMEECTLKVEGWIRVPKGPPIGERDA